MLWLAMIFLAIYQQFQVRICWYREQSWSTHERPVGNRVNAQTKTRETTVELAQARTMWREVA